MESEIFAISPLDGRYKEKVFELTIYFSEAALISYRTKIEYLYLKFLFNFLEIDYSLDNLDFLTEEDIQKIKNIEEETNHDVKAIEIFLKNRINDKKLAEFVHFGLTSQDINSSSYVLSMKECNNDIIIPEIKHLISSLKNKEKDWRNIIMLSKTHGQPASPTMLNKEILVFIERLENQLCHLKNIKYSTKFGGAIGNFNSHYIAFPDLDWIKFGDNFIKSLGLKRNHYTTQIDHYDNYSEIFDSLKRIATILVDLSRDIWLYISNNYFTQKCVKEEVGSSTMPHKINPINFENAEGNLMISISFFEFMSRKLPVSRLQRDLTDSTVLRNIGTCYGYFLIGIKSIISGLKRLEVNREIIQKNLNENEIVLSEAIQSILRREGIPNSYDIIKNCTRGKKFNLEEISKHIEEKYKLNISVLQEIRNLKVNNYVGRF